ncbi:MAG: class 1 isoprenoid biosynthesis enzyme [Maribacter sp.]|nr:class 1 isoprenoid biosynthesis enzyme [Maribacter sp.]
MRNRVFKHMLETRGWKYRVFLRYLRFFKYAAFAPTRGEFLEMYYVLMRFLDDIVDGDTPLPEGYLNESDYITEKIRFSKNPTNPKDEVDYLMLHCFKVAEKFGEEFQAETEDILNSLLFDANRRGKMIIFPKKELMHHFHLLDIRGTIKATLKVFKDDPEKYKILEPLGVACRYQYDLEDIETDLAAGYVNISQEECAQLNIVKEDLNDPSSLKIERWSRNRAKDGIKLLEEHHRRLPKGNFSWLERWTFRLVYEYPARKVFKRIISETQNS